MALYNDDHDGIEDDLEDLTHEHASVYAGEDSGGIEMFTLRSVGIDIGSSTSHLVFSKLTLRREGAGYSSQFKVTDRQVLHRSPITLTPYVPDNPNLIDVDKISSFIKATYHQCGVTPEAIDTGAVVITGEALKKENARPILELFAKESGKFICASAGPNHEALLAAYGCGAVAISQNEGVAVLNVDMGGGTAKLSLIENGMVSQTASVEVGARLIAMDENGRISRIEKPAMVLMGHLGHELALGQSLTISQMAEMSDLMAQVLMEVMQGGEPSDLAKELMLTEPLRPLGKTLEDVRYVVFSGGVSEYVNGHEKASFGDLGPYFGRAVRRLVDSLGRPDLVREPTEGIRATVIGAGEYTVQASGSTSYISSRDVLPVFGLKVVRPATYDGSLADSLRQAMTKFDMDSFGPGCALAIEIMGQQDYWSLRKTAEGLAEVVKGADPSAPLFLILDQDVAKSLGGILKEELHLERELIAIDGIDVGDLDYIDVGRPMGVTEVLPVTVKSLMFPQRSYDVGADGHLHAHDTQAHDHDHDHDHDHGHSHEHGPHTHQHR